MKAIVKFLQNNQKIVLMTGLGFFNGLFLTLYFTFANGLFLENDYREYLPPAYVLSGFIGILLVGMYRRVQEINEKILIRFTYLFLIVLNLILFILYEYVAGFQQPIVITFFTLVSSMYTIVGLQFLGLQLNLFDIRESKKAFGVIGTGGVVASLLGFLTVPVLKQLFEDKSDFAAILIPIGLASLFVSTVLQWWIVHRYPQSLQKKPSKVQAQKRNNALSLIMGDKYLRVIFMVMLFSVLCQYLIDYNFLHSLSNSCKDTVFFAQFFLIIRLVDLTVKSISSWIIANYGLRIGLITVPGLFVFIGAVLILGNVIEGLGNTGHLLGAFLFYTTLGAKLVDRAVKRGLDEPSSKVLYQPLSAAVKSKAKVFIDGYAKQIAIMFSGILLLFLEQIGTANSSLIPVLVGLVIFSMIWLFNSNQSYNLYKEKLKQVLQPVKIDAPNLINSHQHYDWLTWMRSLKTKHLNLGNKILLARQLEGSKEVSTSQVNIILLRWLENEESQQIRYKIIMLCRSMKRKYPLLEFLPKSVNIALTIAILKNLPGTGFKFREDKEQDKDQKEKDLKIKRRYFEPVWRKLLIDLVWLIVIQRDIPDSEEYIPIKWALKKELDSKFELLFELLALILPEINIAHIKQELLSNDVDDGKKIYAAELLENSLDDPNLKVALMAILEEKFELLNPEEYPIFQTFETRRLAEMVYANHFRLSIQAKQVIFELMISDLQIEQFKGTIEAFTYHPDPQIQAMAIRCIKERKAEA